MASNSGIYEIKNVVSETIYIGSAIDINRRFGEHKKHLRHGKHKNKYLQSAWDKYGEDKFVFTVIMSCESDVLIIEEQKSINNAVLRYGWNSLYNLNPIAGSRLGAKLSEESRKKIGLAQIGRKQSTETIAKRIAKTIGRKCSPEIREKMSKSRKGIIFSEDHKRNLSIARRSWKMPIEVFEKQAESRRGRKQSISTCPHCGISGGSQTMPRWHFHNCQRKVGTQNC